MVDEMKYTESNLNAFGKALAQAGVDYHVVLIGDGMTVGPPLGGPNGGPTSRFPPLSDITVSSTNGNNQVDAYWSRIEPMMRKDSTKTFVSQTTMLRTVRSGSRRTLLIRGLNISSNAGVSSMGIFTTVS